jgi:PhzF family phenazine biosynthesis protein
MALGRLHLVTAFTTSPDGGNPAGVWIGDVHPSEALMQTIATDVGFSETAFVAPASGPDRRVRYFSPEAEVSFCGHATIATGVVLGETSGDGTYRLHTSVGMVPVSVGDHEGYRQASLTSVTPSHEHVSGAQLAEVLGALNWRFDELDALIPPVRAYAGAWHLVLAVLTGRRLATLNYDFDQLKRVMLRDGITTLQLIWRESETVFHSRNPFPVGGIVEDPATGAAAAALGGYLRDAGLMTAPARFVIRQGETMGRPSRLTVEVPVSGGIIVRGTAVPISAGTTTAE